MKFVVHIRSNNKDYDFILYLIYKSYQELELYKVYITPNIVKKRR